MNEIIREVIDAGYYITIDGSLFNSKGLEVKGYVNNRGYRRFSFRNEKYTSYPVMIHRLQAYQKYGEKLFEKNLVVRHLDGNPLNNSFKNIGIGTYSENAMDRTAESRSLTSSHPIYDHRSILEDRIKGMSYKELMIKYGISSKGTLAFILNKSIESKT